MRLGHIRFSAKRSKSPRKPPRSFLSPAGAPRRRRGTQALIAGHNALQLLLYYYLQQQDEEAEKGGSTGERLAGGGRRARHKIKKTNLTESPCQRRKAPIGTHGIKQNGVPPPTGEHGCGRTHAHAHTGPATFL